MFLLTKDKYDYAANKIKEVTINDLFARSVVEQHVDGKIYVDNVDAPSAFYILHPYGMSLLYGNISDDFLSNNLKNYLLANNTLRRSSESLQVFPPELEGRIDKVLGPNLIIHDLKKTEHYSDVDVVKYRRINFTFNSSIFEKILSSLNLKNFTFQIVDSSIYEKFNGSVVPKQFWDNASDFVLHGFGFSLTHKNKSAAVAFSSFRHAHMLELGMETKMEYRNRGFATLVCAKLILNCLEKGLEPVWSCRLGNYGSYNLALKLGFEPSASLPYYELMMKAV